MAATSLQRHRPKDESSPAIRDALAGLQADRLAAQQQVSTETARRTALLLGGSDKEIVGAEAAIREAERSVERCDALMSELQQKLVDAVAAEAGAALERDVHAAAASIERFNVWLSESYEQHARAIAEGIDLERAAWRRLIALRNAGVDSSTLPLIKRAFVRSTSRSLEQLCRLPAAVPGDEPIVWLS